MWRSCIASVHGIHGPLNNMDVFLQFFCVQWSTNDELYQSVESLGRPNKCMGVEEWFGMDLLDSIYETVSMVLVNIALNLSKLNYAGLNINFILTGSSELVVRKQCMTVR